MTDQTLNTIIISAWVICGLLVGINQLIRWVKSKRTPLQKFKPGTKVWFIDLSDSAPKSDYYSIKCLPVDESIIVKDGVKYFPIKYCDYMATERELFLKAEDVIKHLESLKSKSNE